MQLLAVAFLVLATPVAVSAETPVERVVALLTSLKAGIEADGVSEGKSYDAFACWCETTLVEKANAISAAKARIEELRNLLIKLKGEIASHGAEVKQLNKDIAANLASTKEAEEMRQKEKTEYVEQKVEAEQCIGALESAIKVLGGAGTGSGKALGTLQESRLLSVAAGVRSVLGRHDTSQRISDSDFLVMRQFVDSPEEFVPGRTQELSAAQIKKNNPFGDYSPQSGKIQGILKGMHDSFALDLEKSNAEEAEKQQSFQAIMGTKKAELSTLQATLGIHMTGEAEKTKSLADSRTEKDVTSEQLQTDEKFFADSKASCAEKAHQWAQRTRLRTEELQGVAKAIEILSSEEATKTFENATTTFVQLSARRQAVISPHKRTGVFASLKAIATRCRSFNIASIAAEVKTGGHFNKVLAIIDKMIATLRAEEQDDIEHRDRCERDENKNTNDIADLEHDLTKVGELTTRLENEKEEKATRIAAVEEDLNKTSTQMAEMAAMRTDEISKFRQGVKDDTEAVALLGQAIVALSKAHERGASLSQQSAEPRPETTFQDGNYKGRHHESGGIIAILTLIQDDLSNEIKTAKQDESSAQAAYENDVAALKDSAAAYTASKVALEREIARLQEKIADAGEVETQKGAEADAKKQHQTGLETDCSWVESHFASRREKRKTEIQGLFEAKDVLAGAEEA